MNKRDFETVAMAIRESWKRFKSHREHAAFANDMADSLATTNPRFDSDRFVMACMPKHLIGGVHSRHWEHFTSN